MARHSLDKSSHAKNPHDNIDTMEIPNQAENNEKTKMVFMTIAETEGQLFTDQTGCFPVTSNRGNNYIVLFYVVDANFIKCTPLNLDYKPNSSQHTMMSISTYASEDSDQNYIT